MTVDERGRVEPLDRGAAAQLVHGILGDDVAARTLDHDGLRKVSAAAKSAAKAGGSAPGPGAIGTAACAIAPAHAHASAHGARRMSRAGRQAMVFSLPRKAGL